VEKLGVVIDDEKTKLGAGAQFCMSCGKKFEISPGMSRCPHCGSTMNFEARHDPSQK
jgi:predicted amidophosphoribosyltransferase